MSPRTRIGQQQLEELGSSLTLLDRELVQDVARFRLMSARHLQRLYYGDAASDDRRCRRRLNQLVEHGVLGRLPRRVGGRGRGSDSTVYRVGRAGKRLLQTSGGAGPAWQPSAAFAAHTLGIVDIYVDLIEQDRGGRIEAIDLTPEPEAWRTFGWQMKPVTLKPDAFAIVRVGGVEHHYFIELDLGTESLTVIENKIGRYVDYYQSGPDLIVFPQVLFPVDSKASYHSVATADRVVQIHAVATKTLPASLGQLVTVAAKNHPPWIRTAAT